MLQEVFQQPGKKTFLQTHDKSYNYEWLQQNIKKTWSLFKSINLHKGEMLLLAVSGDVDMSVIFLSALSFGIPVVITDPETKAPRANAIIQRSAPSCIIADKESLENWKLPGMENCVVIPFIKENVSKPGLLSKFLQKSKTEIQSNDYKSILEKASPLEEKPAMPDTNDIAYIIFTSGTTAASKGVAITHGNLSAHLATLKKVYSLDDTSTILNQLLLAHADGCIQGPVLAAYAGCTWHRPFRFSIEKIPALLDYCYANNISHLIMVPAMLNMLIQFSNDYEDTFRYSKFKALISVSAHLEAPLWDKFESIFKIPINNIYGLTETVAGSLFCGPLNETYRKYTVGKPVDCDIRIVNDLGEDVKEEETGELLLKGPHIIKDYWNDPALTKEAIKEGWFYTGDFASRDAGGFITIKGRKKNLIISGGYNIQPEEVTECLLNNAEISEAAALGLPDEVFGEKLVAAVVLKPSSDLNTFDIVEHCRKFLDDKKVPHKVYILPGLPKGMSDKVQMNLLKEQLLHSHQPKQENTGQYADAVINIAAEAFQVPASRINIRDTSDTIAGWDSLAHLSFITALEEKFNVRFNTAEVITLNSIQKAVNLLNEKNG
ncbi:MAG TPA: AMP-binding protein [Chitinophagaceae bacterium]|nr:AMP-binding protein [Chitinophagaceae bacterium]